MSSGEKISQLVLALLTSFAIFRESIQGKFHASNGHLPPFSAVVKHTADRLTMVCPLSTALTSTAIAIRIIARVIDIFIVRGSLANDV